MEQKVQCPDKRWVLGEWPDTEGFLTRQMEYKCSVITKYQNDVLTDYKSAQQLN